MSPRKRVSSKRSLRTLSAAILGLIAISAGVVADDFPTTITGQAILFHPAGKAVIEAGKLIKAGKLDEVKLASAKDTRDEWAAMPAAEKQEEAERQQAKVPDPKTFEADIANSGTLIIYADSATLRTESASGDVTAMAFAVLEDGKWLVTGGPIMFDPPPVETAPPLAGAAILDHEIGKLTLEFSKRLASGKFDSVLELFTAAACERRAALPSEERKESDEFYENLLPPQSELAGRIRSGGHLYFYGEMASLSISFNSQTENPDGSISYSSESTGLAYQLENGKWRIGDEP